MPNSNPADDYTERTSDIEASASSPTPSSASAHTPAKRGFAAMDEAMQRTIASKGGQSQGKGNNPGNFANNRERAREAGRKGGEAHGHRTSRAQAAQHNTHHP
jgi:general stress protein YciG